MPAISYCILKRCLFNDSSYDSNGKRIRVGGAESPWEESLRHRLTVYASITEEMLLDEDSSGITAIDTVLTVDKDARNAVLELLNMVSGTGSNHPYPALVAWFMKGVIGDK